MWMLAGLFLLLITTAAAQSCPANQIASDPQITLYGESVVPTNSTFRLSANPFDTNLTFFSDILGYSDDEIQQEVQSALQFFSERFGLDFSLTQPNELGLRFFQNATLQPVIFRVPITYATLNRWLLTGNTRSKCFLSRNGGFFVTFSGEQILKGTYGGEEGIDAPSNTTLAYLYTSISVPPPCEPIVIQVRSSMPLSSGRLVKLGLLSCSMSCHIAHWDKGQHKDLFRWNVLLLQMGPCFACLQSLSIPFHPMSSLLTSYNVTHLESI